MSAPVSSLILIVWLGNIFSAYLEIECTHLLLELIVPMVLVHLILGNPLTSGILSRLRLRKVVAAIFFMHIHM